MKVKFLGTIAAEGGPALFCNCDYCKKARILGGKNIRTRSQILLNDDLLVDFPPDTYAHKLAFNLDLSKVKYLFITHSHEDHFYAQDLWHRKEINAREMVEPTLEVYGNLAVKNIFEKTNAFIGYADPNIRFHLISEFEEIETERYKVWTLKAQHAVNENAVFYLFKQGNKTFMQCNDTGYLNDETFAFLEKLGIKIDLISFDCTMGSQPYKTYYGHMGLEEVFEITERMKRSNYTQPTTRYVITHLCHNGGLLMHEDYEKLCAPHGIEVAYDGMEIEF